MKGACAVFRATGLESITFSHPKCQARHKVDQILVVVSVLLCRALVVERVDTTALWATSITLARQVQPERVVRVSGESSAANDALWKPGVNFNGLVDGAQSGHLQWLHVEDIDTLQVSENL